MTSGPTPCGVGFFMECSMRYRLAPVSAVFLCLLFVSSCAGVPSDRHAQIGMEIRILDEAQVAAYGEPLVNPFIARKLLSERETNAFAVCELKLPPMKRTSVRLVSAEYLDGEGNPVARYLPYDEFVFYWDVRYLFEEQTKKRDAIMNRHYLHRSEFNYASRTGHEYILVFIGKDPLPADGSARVVLAIDGAEAVIEGKR